MVISGCRLACLGGAEKPLHGGARRLEPPGDFVRRVLQRAIAGKRAIQFHGQAGAVVLENGNRLVALRPTGIGLRTGLRRLLQEIESTRKPLKRSIDRVGAGRLCHHLLVLGRARSGGSMYEAVPSPAISKGLPNRSL